MLLFLLSLTKPPAAVAKDADPNPLWEMRLEQERLEAELAKKEKEMERLLAEKDLLIDRGYLEQPAEARGVRNQKKLRRGAFAKPGRPSSLFCKTCPFYPLLVGGYSTAASASSFEM
jgi:hypothetical protein